MAGAGLRLSECAGKESVVCPVPEERRNERRYKSQSPNRRAKPGTARLLCHWCAAEIRVSEKAPFS
jgi:hypothetical protein